MRPASTAPKSYFPLISGPWSDPGVWWGLVEAVRTSENKIGELKRMNATTSSPFRRISAFTSPQQIEIQLEDGTSRFSSKYSHVNILSAPTLATLPRESTSFPMRQLLSQRHSLLLSRSTCICKDCLPPCIGTPAHRGTERGAVDG